MRKALLIACTLALAPALLRAQTPRWSLGGTLTGVSYFTEAGALDFAAPGGGPLVFQGATAPQSAPEIYAGFFPHPQIAVVPGVAFAYSSPGDGDSRYGLALDLALEWHLTGVSASSFYLAVNGAFLAFDLGATGSTSDFAAGAAIGYRLLPYDFFGLRFEGVYRRYFDLEENQITGVVKVEVIFN